MYTELIIDTNNAGMTAFYKHVLLQIELYTELIIATNNAGMTAFYKHVLL